MVPHTAHRTSWTAPTMTRSAHTTIGGAQTPSTIGIAKAKFTIRAQELVLLCVKWVKHEKAAKWIHIILCTSVALVFNL